MKISIEGVATPTESQTADITQLLLRSASQTGKQPRPSIVYGRWSVEGTWWQAVKFLTPLVAMVAVVLHATAFR